MISQEKVKTKIIQMYIEILEIICYSQYYNLRNQKVFIFVKRVDFKSFIIHFDDLHASIYSVMFSFEYLRIIQSVGLDKLSKKMRIDLNHIQFYNLLDSIKRIEFIKHFVALLRFLAEGYEDMGHLRRDGNNIHRTLPEKKSNKEIASSWMILNYDEEIEWFKKHHNEYEF